MVLENSAEVEAFKRKSVYVVCRAGSDRSKYIAEELTKRGYMATHGGTLKNHNYATREDIAFVGAVIFSSAYEKEQFDKDSQLKDFIKRNGISTHLMHVTECDKNKAHATGKIDELRKEISSQLDTLGFKPVN